MTTKNNIPAGYKESAVGIIPQEWEVATLGKLGKVISGLTYSPDDISDTGILVLRSSNIQNGMLCMADNVYVNTVSYNPVKTGDILICVRNGSKNLIGKSAYITPHYEGVAFGAFMSIYRSANNNYLKHLFNSDIFYKNVHRNLGATINSINGNDLKKFVIPIPSLAEQRKIAEILGVWDEAIEKQSRLIEKLELRKRALMQRLLTGRTRLPGFTAPWQKVKLGEIGKITSAGVDKKINEGEVPVRLLNFVDVFYRDFIYNNELTHWVTAKSTKVEQCSVQKGDIFFTPSSEMPTDIALSAVAMEDMEGVVYSYHIVRLRLHIEMDLYYRAYAFKTDEFYKQAERICDGSGQRYVISQDGFRNMSIHLPSLPEQKAIAEVLTVADKEIATHRKKLDALRLQKRGLMQQLLTGKTRVKNLETLKIWH